MKYSYFNFKKWNEQQILLTNDLGQWAFVSLPTFQAMLLHKLDSTDPSYAELLEKGFLYEDDADVYLERHSRALREAKGYLMDATSLHIFVLTNECNARCIYCQAQSAASHKKGLMSAETAKKAVNLAFQSPEPFLSIEFQGGEPLLNFDTIQVIVSEAEKKAAETRKKVEFSLVSNLNLLNDEMVRFFQAHRVSVSTSIDGPMHLHNRNRPLCQGGGTYEGTIRGLKRLQAVCQHSEAERRLMAEKYIAQSERNLMELSRQNLDELRAIRHDIKNQYAYMDVLLSEKRYDELLEFFDQNKQANSKPLSGIDCGNLVLNTILNLEQGRAHAQGCVLDHRIFVAPQLPFAETDLCSLFTNLIDNALEAIQRQNIANGVVEVGINQKNAGLYICVLNPVDEQLGRETLLSCKTTKKDKTMHGYGVRIVDGIVQKYNGQISRSIENGKYRVDIMLDLRWAENAS